MSLILCIETGTDVCSVALSKNGKPVSIREENGRDHARKIAVFAEELLRESGISPKELDAVAIGKGPGSYTGLRIGTSFAKGLCYALNIPLIAIDSLESMARIAAEDHEAGLFQSDSWENALLCPMIDARRMEVYAGIYNTHMNIISPVVAEVITEDSFSQQIDSTSEFFIFGSGAAKTLDILRSDKIRLINVSPSARGLCIAAQHKLDAGELEDMAYFEPAYLKDFVVTASKKKFF